MMPMRRRALIRLACVWCLWQLLVTVASPVVISISAAHHAGATECQCGHGLGAVCPMHKTPTGKSTCTLRGVTQPAELMLVSLLASVGPADTYVSAPPLETGSPLEPDTRAPIDRHLPPDSPPPRA